VGGGLRIGLRAVALVVVGGRVGGRDILSRRFSAPRGLIVWVIRSCAWTAAKLISH
jgi:hypothetical protein